MASIKDVARQAGVAISTVSKVLNGYEGVSESTKDKVNAAIEALNYTPNAVAAALSSKQFGRVALLLKLEETVGCVDEINLQYLSGAIHRAKELKLDVVKRGALYIGWSAGANLACPTIRTTNDMPIVDPQGFDALNLFPLQINPHFTNALPEGHKGETREQRIRELLVVAPELTIIGLPEGNWITVSKGHATLGGPNTTYVFKAGEEAVPLEAGHRLDRKSVV